MFGVSNFFVLFPLSMAMEEQRRPPSSKIAPMSMKASSANDASRHEEQKPFSKGQENCTATRRVDKLRKKLWHEKNVH